MTDRKQIELSRRKVLGGLGTIGIASAGAGLGTSAYFSDEETFKNNTLTAGSLDLKIDWEEHYADWSEDEGEGLANEVIMAGKENGIGTDYVGLPDPANPLIYVHEDDLAQFMANTGVEAFPDPDNDGLQEFELDGEDNGTGPIRRTISTRVMVCERIPTIPSGFQTVMTARTVRKNPIHWSTSRTSSPVTSGN